MARPALAEDGVDYLSPGGYCRGGSACLSCLLVAGRHQELLELLELDHPPMWYYRHYGVEALLAQDKKAQAIQYAARRS